MPLRRVLSTSWAPVIVTALFTIALLLRYDVGVLDVVVYAVYFALGVSMPGVLAWRMLLAHLHTDGLRGPEPLGQHMHERGVEVVDALAQPVQLGHRRVVGALPIHGS